MTAEGLIERRARAGGTLSTALYSPCEAYRYALTREWSTGPRLLYVMLNPSKATEAQNDPTVERCERRARALGFGAFRVCNLFGWRETSPALLKRAQTPVGPANDTALLEGAQWVGNTGVILCGWGVHGAYLGRGAQVTQMLRDTKAPLRHLGLTKEGHPRHPLYVAYAQHLLDWQ